MLLACDSDRRGTADVAFKSACCPPATDIPGNLCYHASADDLFSRPGATAANRTWGAKARFRGGTGLFAFSPDQIYFLRDIFSRRHAADPEPIIE